jgi:hypothetical protein
LHFAVVRISGSSGELLILRRYAGRQGDIAGIVARSPRAVSVLSIHIPTVSGTLGGGAVGEGAPIGDRCRGISSGGATAVSARNPPVRGALRILDGDGSPPGTCLARLDQRGQKDRDDNTILISRSVHLTSRTEFEEKRLREEEVAGVAEWDGCLGGRLCLRNLRPQPSFRGTGRDGELVRAKMSRTEGTEDTEEV